ncbi:MAG TPA: CBS domain-containing protein [Burkholderiaceae bacterium]|nr:CBS domain-containing protein [Burkholderiaceae bacterium]
MRVSEAMTHDVSTVRPDETLQQAALKMAELDAGVLPVGADDRLVGMITDRDIAVRAVAKGNGPETKVRDAMSEDVKYCFEDEDLDAVQKNMGYIRVRRLPVVNRQKRLVGIVSLGDIVSTTRNARKAGQALAGISQPGGGHSQALQR